MPLRRRLTGVPGHRLPGTSYPNSQHTCRQSGASTTNDLGTGKLFANPTLLENRMLVSLRTALAASLTAGLVGAAVLFATPAQAAPPAFVQQQTAHGFNTATRSVTMGLNTLAGNRLIVQVGVW